MRSCGDCRACCVVLGVRELEKPPSQACAHMEKGGCGIYETRPQACRDYACSWLGGAGLRRDRPDRVGVIVDAVEAGKLRAREIVPGAFGRKRAKALVEGLHRMGYSVQLHPFGGRKLPVGEPL